VLCDHDDHDFPDHPLAPARSSHMCTFVLYRKRSSPLHMPRKISVIPKSWSNMKRSQHKFQSDPIYNYSRPHLPLNS
jgi:hypothetical protein